MQHGPAGVYVTRDEQSYYLRLNFPQQSIAFYERRRGNQGPAFAINYSKREPEERDGERRKVIHVHLHCNNPKEGIVLTQTQKLIIKI